MLFVNSAFYKEVNFVAVKGILVILFYDLTLGYVLIISIIASTTSYLLYYLFSSIIVYSNYEIISYLFNLAGIKA